MLSESLYPAKLEMPLHAHERAYVGIVLKGSYTETADYRRRDCGPLMAVYHPEGESHSVVFHDSTARIFRVEVTESWRPKVEAFSQASAHPVEFEGGVPAWLALRLRAEFRARDRWSTLAIEGLALELFAELGRSLSARLSGSSFPAWLEHAREILESSPSNPPSLTNLAGAVGVHPVHLAREFRRRYRCTIGDFIRRRRIELACREITGSDASLSEIALASGFYDQSHFSNTFRRFTGMTPGAYRASCKTR